MRKKNRKFNVLGKLWEVPQTLLSAKSLCNYARPGFVISSLSLLFLMFLLVNPFVGVSASALEDEAGEDETIVGENDNATIGAEGDNIDGVDNVVADGDDDDIMELAATTSLVGISFSPAMYYASLSPTSAGQSARIDITATINVANSGGYTVYLKSNSANLVGVNNSNNVIPGASSAKTYANMDTNTWGYAWQDGATAVPDTATYRAVTVSGNGQELAKNNTGNNIDTDSKTIALSFATKINDQKPADTYSNTMTLSVVSSPMKIVEVAYDYGGITNMQQMTTAICSAAPVGGVKQLKDTRDGKYYWIGKLADNKCWMTQNLDLDLSTSTTLTSSTSDVTSNWKPGYTTAATVTSSTISTSATNQYSWSLGNYRITNPTSSSDCGSKKNSLADCTSQFTAYTTPTTANNDINAHYIVGNHYTWSAATAGTGSSITGNEGDAPGSICPKGWRLPLHGTSVVGSFLNLVNKGSIGSDAVKFTSAPYYFVRGGDVDQIYGNLFRGAGNSGSYWTSSIVNTNVSQNEAYYFYFAGSNFVDSMSNPWVSGFSVRCVAR